MKTAESIAIMRESAGQSGPVSWLKYWSVILLWYVLWQSLQAGTLCQRFKGLVFLPKMKRRGYLFRTDVRRLTCTQMSSTAFVGSQGVVVPTSSPTYVLSGQTQLQLSGNAPSLNCSSFTSCEPGYNCHRDFQVGRTAVYLVI